MPKQAENSEYVFDNAGDQTIGRFAGLERLFDSGTFRHLDNLAVAPGWLCLEVGGGSGSVAGWLSQRVGAQGQVVVTDINTRFLTGLTAPNIEVREHDIVNAELEKDHYDLAHTRLVLLHIPEQERAIDRIISALRPGGLVPFEEFDALSMIPDPHISPSETMLKTLTVLWRDDGSRCRSSPWQASSQHPRSKRLGGRCRPRTGIPHPRRLPLGRCDPRQL